MIVAIYERFIISKGQLSPNLIETHPQTEDMFKDSYMLDFLNLPDNHSETDLRLSNIKHLQKFLLEFGKDFIF